MIRNILSFIFLALLFTADLHAQVPIFTAGLTASVTVVQNSTANPINTQLTITDPDIGQTEVWKTITTAVHGFAPATCTLTSTGGTVVPIGLFYTPITGYSGLDSFRVRVTDGTLSDTIKIYVTVTPLPYAPCVRNIATIAGISAPGNTGDGGPATIASLNNPTGIGIDVTGNVYLCMQNSDVRTVNTAGIINRTVGGGLFGYGGDGLIATATAVKMKFLSDVKIDNSGNIYITDKGDHRIRKVNGAGIISTYAGTGLAAWSGDGGPATAADIAAPGQMAFDAAGNLYFSETGSNVVRKITTGGIISTVAGNGTAGFAGDGAAATAAQLNQPYGLAIDGAGNMYIGDGNRRIRKVTPAGIISTYAGTGSAGYAGDGSSATSADIDNPYSVVADALGNIYFSAANNTIRKIDASGIISTIAGDGTAGYSGDGGPATGATFKDPVGLEIDKAGNLYVGDKNNFRARKIGNNRAPVFTSGHTASITVVQNSTANPVNLLLGVADADPGQTITWSLAGGPAHGTAAVAYTMTVVGGTMMPTGITYTPTPGYSSLDSFKVLIIDCAGGSDYMMVYVTVTPLPTGGCSGGIITTIAGTNTAGYSGDNGPATAAKINFAFGVAPDGLGNIYVSDGANNRIRKVDAAGVITTVAGNGTAGYSGDGGPATAGTLKNPYGIAADAAGNVFVSDFNNKVIRKINNAGIITTIGGGGVSTADGVPATTASFVNVYSICTDGAGTVYVSDGTGAKIRKIDPAGIITTVAGTGVTGYSGDGGPATAAKIAASASVAIDPSGNLYITDQSVFKVRKISTSGIITSIAGNGTAGYTGDGGPATNAKINCYAAAADAAGNVYISDKAKNIVRRVDASGIITTIAGIGTTGYSGDGGPATAAEMNWPSYLNVDNGNLYIADWLNHAVRKVTLSSNNAPVFVNGHSQTISMCGGFVKIDTQLSIKDADAGQAETWKLITPPLHGTATTTYTTTSTGGLIIPTGLSYFPTTGYTGTDVIQVSITDCSGMADTTTITITAGTAVTAGIITGPSSVCVGNTISLTDATPGGVWSSSNTNVTISSTGVVTGINMGTASISYTVTGSCNTAIAKGAVTVINMPAPISGPGNVCTGVTVALTDPTSGGVWTSSNTTMATVSSGSVFGVAPGSAVISYTIGGVCSVNTTINIDPPLPAIKGPGKVCVGNTVTLSDSVIGGSWYCVSGAISIDPFTGDATGMMGGTGIITYAVSTGCIAVKSFTVNANPAPIVLTTPVMCYSDKGIYASDMDLGGIWTSSLVTVSMGGYLTAYRNGSGLITYTLPTGCFTTTPITVNPLPGLITGTNKICEGQLSALSDTTYGGTWSTTDAAVVVDIYSGGLYGSSPGTAVVTYQLPTTCFLVDTITVYPKPTAILGTLNICPGNSTLLSDALAGGTWSISAGGYGSIDATTGVATGIMAGTATVTYTSGLSCSITAPLTIWPLPSPFTVAGGGHYCAGGTGVHVSLTGSAGGIKYYLFNGSTLVDSLTGAGGLLDYGPRTAGLYTIYAVSPLTQCGNTMTGSAMVVEDPILLPAVSINTLPGDTVCEGGSITFVAGVVNEGPTPAYQWKVNGIPAGTGLNTYTYVPKDGDLVGIEMTSSAACVAPATVYGFRTVTVVSPVTPVLTLTADPGVSIPEGATVTFTATITSKTVAPTYQWLKNAAPIAGETNATYTATDIKNYDTISCRVWSGGFCSMSAIERLHMNVYKTDGGNNTAVNGIISTDAAIRVIPNPSRGAFTVTGWVGNTTEGSVTLELTDMIGRMIYKGDAAVKDGRVNTEVQLNNTIASGTYLLNVRSGAMHKVFHIIIEQ